MLKGLNWSSAAEKFRANQSTGAAPSSARVLVVDDEVTNTKLMAEVLREDFIVATANSAIDALEMALESDFAVIVTDHKMPKMSGTEFCMELARRNIAASRVIVTAYSELDQMLKAINEARVFHYLTKPVHPDELRAKVKAAAHDHQTRTENKRLLAMVKSLIENQAELTKQVIDLGGTPSAPDADAQKTLSELSKPRIVPVSVLMADIRGFTKFSQSVDPSIATKTLQEILKLLHDSIYTAGGLVDKHLGDGLMGVFGLGRSSVVDRAVEAVDKIVERYPDYRKRLQNEQARELRLSVGLAHGTALLGTIGTDRRTELAVIGQPPNLATRLQEFTNWSLNSPNGAAVLGDFGAVMAIAANIPTPVSNAWNQVTLPDDIRVRDFQSTRELWIRGG